MKCVIVILALAMLPFVDQVDAAVRRFPTKVSVTSHSPALRGIVLSSFSSWRPDRSRTRYFPFGPAFAERPRMRLAALEDNGCASRRRSSAGRPRQRKALGHRGRRRAAVKAKRRG